jgi:hypothetical protein
MQKLKKNLSLLWKRFQVMRILMDIVTFTIPPSTVMLIIRLAKIYMKSTDSGVKVSDLTWIKPNHIKVLGRFLDEYSDLIPAGSDREDMTRVFIRGFKLDFMAK